METEGLVMSPDQAAEMMESRRFRIGMDKEEVGRIRKKLDSLPIGQSFKKDVPKVSPAVRNLP